MTLYFATSTRLRAFAFLQTVAPVVTETIAGPLLDFVEADIVRIADPDYHFGGRVGILPGRKWHERHRDAVTVAARAVQNLVGGEPK